MFAILTTGSRPVAIVMVVLTDMPSLYLQATDFCHFCLRGTTGRPASGTGAQEKTVVPLTSPSPWSVPSRLPLTPSFSYLAPACFFSSICSLIPFSSPAPFVPFLLRSLVPASRLLTPLSFAPSQPPQSPDHDRWYCSSAGVKDELVGRAGGGQGRDRGGAARVCLRGMVPPALAMAGWGPGSRQLKAVAAKLEALPACLGLDEKLVTR